jgi:hypothetical protein
MISTRPPLKTLDLGDNRVGRLFLRHLAASSETRIVDDDAGALFRQQQGDFAADTGRPR